MQEIKGLKSSYILILFNLYGNVFYYWKTINRIYLKKDKNSNEDLKTSVCDLST